MVTNHQVCEAALLTAYTLVASNNPEVTKYLENSVIFIDPTINPDGRDRHTQWANQFLAKEMVSDGADAEHNEILLSRQNKSLLV
ncbi:MAG: M14 family zinc carboxypeptidase [Flavobacteriaceae bacterium]